jgi:serine/threonine protein kinase
MIIILELAECNLSTYRQKNEEIDVKGIGIQLFKGLEYIHSKMIIHADIKQSNILVFEGGKRVAICDFGSNWTFDNIPSYHDITTLTHRAPEILAWQKKWDEKIDIWGMGVVYYFLLTKTGFIKSGSPILDLHQITNTFGYLPFDNPKLPFDESYWNDRSITYGNHKDSNKFGDSNISKCLKIESNDIINASMIPIPEKRKTATEIISLFQNS